MALFVMLAAAGAASAQNPECRYWSARSARGWAQGGYNALRGNVPGALYHDVRAARDTGRAGYFCSPQWDRDRGAATRSPNWDSRSHYFRR